VITELRQREVRGLIDLRRPLQLGDTVRVARGPFRNQLGIYAGQASHERVAVLLTLLGGQHRVTMRRDDVEAV